MTHSLPPSPNLEQLKKQARALLRAFRVADQQAIDRVARVLPSTTPFSLTRAQFVLAREYGFASWPKLREYLAELPQRTPALPSPAMLSPASAGSAAPRDKHAHLKLMAEHLRQKPHVLDLTEQLLILAHQGTTEELIGTLWRMPARLILAVRANILATGHYATLADGLIAALDHPRARIRQGAAQALDLLADERCVPALRRALNDPVARVRRTALHALTCDDCKIAPLRAVVWEGVGEHDPPTKIG
jgi:hypothetical protein